MKKINRRKFIKEMSQYTGGAIIGGAILNESLLASINSQFSTTENIYIAKNGTPAENVAKVFDMKYGGIENFIGIDDVVVINPNGQWPNQGGSNCGNCIGLIDMILNRPGGFNGEILFVECTQAVPTGYWVATGTQLDRNGPYNFNDMITYYQNNGHANVNSVRIQRNQNDSTNWPVISSPTTQGWVRLEWTSPTTGCLFYLPYPVIRSPYSNRLISLKDGVYKDGQLTSTPLKFIKVPNLNNHDSTTWQDYAGVTSATKSFLGIAELENATNGIFNDGQHYSLHTYGQACHGPSAAEKAWACGEAVGAWMTFCRKPDIFLTTAEWSGWGGRYNTNATQTRTVGLAENPPTLDYYMCKYVLSPSVPLGTSAPYLNPDYNVANNNTRQTIEGCISQGYGTSDENEMAVFVYDYNAPVTNRQDIDLKIKLFREGNATEQDVIDLINLYNSGN